MKKMSRYIVMLFAIAVLVSCGNGKKEGVREKTKTETSDDEATEDEESADADQAPDINKTSNSVRMTGKLALDPQNRADISPIAGGVVRRILTREGYQVGRGQIVAYIENTEVVALQRQYIASVSERSTARLELNRQITLTSQGAGVQKTLQQAEAAYAMANASVLGIGRQLRQLGVNPSSVSLGRITTLIPVSSPISGIVGKINISMGSYVDMTTSLMTVVNNVNLHCDMKAFEKDLPKVRIGQIVNVSLTNSPMVKFRARIYDINSTFDDGSKSVTVHAKIIKQPASKLLPDMFVTGVVE